MAARSWPRSSPTRSRCCLGAAALAWAAGIVPIAIAIVVVILINAGFAFAQEQQAERAVEALAGFLPARDRPARREAERIEAAQLVPGDILAIEEGIGSPRTPGCSPGASRSTSRRSRASRCPPSARPTRSTPSVPLLEARELVFSGTTCTEGRPRARRLRDRDAHRARAHRGAVRARGARGEPARAPGPPGGLAHRR